MHVEFRTKEPKHELIKQGHLITWSPEKKTRLEVFFEFTSTFFSFIITKTLSLSFSKIDLPVKGMEYHGKDLHIGFIWLHVERGGK